MTIKISEIASVYSGIGGRCCCGCSGIYRYASAHKNARPSYMTEPNEGVSDSFVKRVINKLEKIGYKDEGYAYVGVDHSASGPGRLYIAYKVEKEAAA